jgi:signal peptidase I
MSIFEKIGSWMSSLGMALVVAFIFGIFIIQPYKVQGHSMDPTLYDKERLYVSKLSHTFFVKRVIGKPGDVLEFKAHKVYRNSEALNEPYIKEMMNYESDNKWVVPDNHIFVLGDNRNNSEDSRMIGFIPLDHVMGKKL